MIKHFKNFLKKHLNPFQYELEKNYEEEMRFWPPNSLSLDAYSFFFKLGALFRWEFQSPATVAQIREEELRTRASEFLYSSLHIWIRNSQELEQFFTVLQDRIGENGGIVFPVNGHLVIAFKRNGNLRLVHSTRMRAEDFVKTQYHDLNRKFPRIKNA